MCMPVAATKARPNSGLAEGKCSQRPVFNAQFRFRQLSTSYGVFNDNARLRTSIQSSKIFIGKAGTKANVTVAVTCIIH